MRFPALLLSLAVLAAACGGSDDPLVATVNGQEIHRSDVVALRTTPDDLVVLDSEDFRQELMYLIVQESVATALLDEFDASVSDEDVEVELAARLAGGRTVAEAVAAMEDPAATESRLREVIRSGLLRNRAMRELAVTDEFLDDIFANRIDAIAEVCVRHVLVDTDVLAAAVKAQIEGGRDFGEVAREVTLDEGAPDGNLGCASPARYVPAFADATLEATVGEVFGPIETDFGWHVVLVDDRYVPTRLEVEADPAEFLPEELMANEFTAWFNDRLKSADITVLADVGEWTPEGPGILPPSDS